MRPKRLKPKFAKHSMSQATKEPTFTEAGLRLAEPRTSDYTVNDPKVAGLYLKITPKGRKVFVYRYRSTFGRQRKVNIGKFSELNVAEVRRKALALAAEVSAGGDPASDRLDKRHAITVAAFAEKYLKEQAKPRLAASTYKEYRRVLQTRVLPRIGKLAMVEVKRSDIEGVHFSMSDTPIRANRMLSVVKAMMFKAEDWDVIPRGSNPASRIKMNKERPKQHYFTDAEQTRIFRAIDVLRADMLKSGPAFDAITLLFFTGCRTSEVLKLKWEDIDLDAAVATLHNTKTGEARLPLAGPALKLLQSIVSKKQDSWVFEGATAGERLKSLVRPWRRICEHADLPEACLKDIRHTVGTYVAKEGGLFSAQVVLRHTSPKTTMRYAHPFEASVRGDLENAMKHIENNKTKKTTRKRKRK
ncbi:tyrosine-type recombinase/integrase [Sulfitobacter guttiformis]|uniref:Site-specific recombinase XerD n=1 Tax=Sulfitobacter guttiformis TaxID=74349 RepID=A0A420DHC5_9RHOB|nr:site-specific integrase [Sulfitobacter guttiformis]RKE93626.1 site-specific recombinase XerD [Sulfitobacter guttiformis]